MLLLELHPAILEPDLDLALGQQQIMRDLDAAPPGQVPVVVELLLQLERLEAGVRGPLALRLAHRVDAIFKYALVCDIGIGISLIIRLIIG